ncbi:TetR/AcrR family transcriptional regulator [Actinomadura macrotermitis]|uniref:HTH tetR-type domain-containing protein n=1 Tax=Actinomadura macrotermitis TaxID=2585200 RepID=A0A7K0BN04_9ACTN|nr:hypothetical protein [Actinomadura macrotermitis]
MTDPSPRRPTKGERTRSRILDSAAELFSRSGFHAVSLRDIAAHAGLTHAGLLHHFPSKEALLIKVLGRRDRHDALLLFPPGHEPRADELLDDIVGVVSRNMRTPGLVGLYVKISGEAVNPEHPAHDYFVQRYQVLRDRLTWAFGQLFAQASPPLEHDPALAARQLLGLMDGLQTQWLLEPDAIDMQACVVAFLRQFGLTVHVSPKPFKLPAEGRGTAARPTDTDPSNEVAHDPSRPAAGES